MYAELSASIFGSLHACYHACDLYDGGLLDTLTFSLQEILDETDQYVDNEMRHAVNTANLVNDLPPQLRNSLKLRQGLSRSRSGRITVSGSLNEGNIVPVTGKPTGKPSPRRNLSKPSSSVVVSRKTGAANQTMDILEPLMQSPHEQTGS